LEIPPLTLRTNSLRSTRKELLDRLAADGFSAQETPVSPLGVTLEKCGNPGHLSVIQEGLCYVEDEAAQLIPSLLDPQPGDRILDACAAPGGKTTHLAQLMQNQGTIIALDRHGDRLLRLMANCKRFGISIVQTHECDMTDLLKIPSEVAALPTAHRSFLIEPFDRILVDAPCSGLGILRRHPEGKMLKQLSTIEQSHDIQRQILDRVCTLLRPGGTIVYSACSIEPEETTEVISAFCQEHPEFQPVPVTPWVPPTGLSLVTDEGHLCTGFQSFTMDAFFACRLRKSETQ
jgi:16S rRNA (cytosine967-C5)-methyltransferase